MAFVFFLSVVQIKLLHAAFLKAVIKGAQCNILAPIKVQFLEHSWKVLKSHVG